MPDDGHDRCTIAGDPNPRYVLTPCRHHAPRGPRTASVAAPSLLVGALITFAFGPALGAQPADTTRRSTKPLFTRNDILVAGAFTAGTVGMFQFDRRIAVSLLDTTSRSYQRDRRRASQLKVFNERSLFAVSAVSYVAGRLGHGERIADIGLHSMEAIVVTTALATVGKSGLGRSRPFVTGGKDPTDFHPGKGFRDPAYRSFPSLHEGGTFAFAAVVTAETARMWPRSRPWVGPALYTMAAVPGVARLYLSKHWASDVVVGAAIGTFAGWKVVRYNHSHPGNRVDRWLLGMSIESAEDGTVMIGARLGAGL